MEKKFIIEELKKICPSKKEDIEEYCEDFSEIYLHLIFGDILNPYMLELLNNIQENAEQLTKIAELLEAMAKDCDYNQEVVVTTVLERLNDDENVINNFKLFAGENTLKFIDDL